MYFTNRYHAAIELSHQLDQYKNMDGVVLAIPRGGVPIGHYMAEYLGFTLDLLMAKKIGHPSHEEYAIGAVGLEDSIVEETGIVSEEYLEKEIIRIRQQLKERYRQFMGDHEPVSIRGKIVIITDDGIATGRTILTTLKMLRHKQPSKLIVAVPVSSRQAAARMRQEVDEFVCLYIPSVFPGVGKFYQDFTQVEDTEVMTLLKS